MSSISFPPGTEPSATETVGPQPDNPIPTDTNETIMNDTNTLTPYIPPPPITIEDLLNEKEVILKKEDSDRILCSTIFIPPLFLKEKLIDWACKNFPAAYELSRVQIRVPPKCSDGVSRNIYEYIPYLSGKSISDYVQQIQATVDGMQIGATTHRDCIVISVNKL